MPPRGRPTSRRERKCCLAKGWWGQLCNQEERSPGGKSLVTLVGGGRAGIGVGAKMGKKIEAGGKKEAKSRIEIEVALFPKEEVIWKHLFIRNLEMHFEIAEKIWKCSSSFALMEAGRVHTCLVPLASCGGRNTKDTVSCTFQENKFFLIWAGSS